MHIYLNGAAAALLRRRRAVCGWMGLLLLWLLLPANVQAQLPANFVDEPVISELSQPVSMVFLPDGRLLVLQKGGTIVVADPSQSWSTATYMTIANIESGNERGLLDITLDPNFETNGYFYLYYSPDSPEGFRISRFTHQENMGGLTSTGSYSSEFVVWTEQWPGTVNTNVGVYQPCCHYGGGLDFGPDGKLWLTIGDKFNGENAQDRASSAGSIIRLNPDGTVPDGTDGWPANPYINNSDGWDEYIWAYGIRNPFRARWDLSTERFLVGEVGGNDQDRSQEDLHLVKAEAAYAGLDYGWPRCEGQAPYDDFPNCDIAGTLAEPVYAYPHTTATPDGGSITGGFIYRGTSFPAQYHGVYFFGDYAVGYIRYITFEAGDPTLVSGAFDFQPAAGMVVALEEGPDGALYYAQISGAVRRIVYDGLTVTASAAPTSGVAPLTVSFDGDATNTNGTPTYTWIFGDGTSANGLSDPAVSHTYTSDGHYTAVLKATVGTTTAQAEPIAIQMGEPPAAKILAPMDGAFFRAGDIVSFSGDDNVQPGNSVWDIRFGHNDHFHPVLDDYVGTSGSFSIPTSGHDYSDSTRYEITLTVTEENGLSDTDVVNVYPDKANVTYESVPSGIPVTVDAIARSTPYTVDDLKGFERNISAPEMRCIEGVKYVFDSWSDGGALEHTLVVPNADITLTATFTSSGECAEVPVTSGLVAHFESDVNVTTSGGNVVGWLDQSGSGNDLSAVGDPQLVAGTSPSGQPAIAFQGSGDKLQRTATLNNFPGGGADRTMFAVVNYSSNGWGGVSFGNNSCGQTSGLVVSKEGDLAVQRWCNDYATSVAGNGAGWLVQSAVLSGTSLTHFKNGAVIDTKEGASFNTVLDRMVIGAEIDSDPYLVMDVAAVLLYDRPLSETERQQVETYLQDKYLADSSPSTASVTITAPTDGEVVTGPDVTVSWAATAAAAGDHVHITLDGNTLIEDQPLDGSYDFSGLVDSTHTISVEVVTKDHVNYTDPEATDAVTFTYSSGGPVSIPTAGLVLRLESDLNVTTSGGNVVGWLDQSGSGNDLSAVGDPQLVAGASPSGQPAIAFQGSGDKLQRTATLNNFPGGGADRTMFTVVNYSSNGWGGVSFGNNSCGQTSGLAVTKDGDLAVQRWCNDYATAVAGNGAGWLVQSAVLSGTSLTHFKNGAVIDTKEGASFNTVLDRMIIGAEIDSDPYLVMDVAAVLLYDRPLSETERQQVETYLQDKYLAGTPGNAAPVIAAITDQTVEEGQTVSVEMSASDADGDAIAFSLSVINDTDGSAVPDSFYTFTDAGDGTGTFSWTPGTGDSGDYTTTATASDGSVSATETFAITVALDSDTSGAPFAAELVLHLESDTGVTESGTSVSAWADQSGSGNDLTAAGDPQLISGATPSGHAAIHLDGQGDELVRFGSTDSITALPSGNADRALFSVLRYSDATAWAGVSYGRGASNKAFGLVVNMPDQSRAHYLVLQGWGSGNDIISPQPGVNTDGTSDGWLTQSAVLSGGTAEIYKNGASVAAWSHNYDTIVEKITIGREINDLGYATMDVAAVLLYNRALSETERQQVEQYLQDKYFTGALAKMASKIDTEGPVEIPTDLAINAVYPNPFSSQTTLSFNLPEDSEISIEVYDVLGRRVLQVDESGMPAGPNRQIRLGAAHLASGLYIFRLTARMPSGTAVEVGRFTVVR